LGLAEESAGIMILPSDAPLGKPVFDVLGLKDVRYELGLTPNRPDCLSLVGVAREVAAMVGGTLHITVPDVCEGEEEITALARVDVEEPELCPRYAARLIRGVKVGPSPDWLVRRLESVGLRSVNNVVDVTNLILMELGHPLHAFDLDYLRERRIVVERADEGERFTTLDGQERVLSHADLVICDGQGPVALAGIMGGENSEIRPETSDILLESAYFNPVTIRRSSKRLGLHTEASHRYERGADVEMVPVALDKAAALIVEVSGGTVCRGVLDNYSAPPAERKVMLAVRRVNDILGLSLAPEDIQGYLHAIGLPVQPAAEKDEDLLVVTIPTFRPDLEREIDLIEEVARLNGYDKIPVTMPVSRMICHRPPRHLDTVRRAREAMVRSGYAETVNYSFISPVLWERLGLEDDDPRRQSVAILNPLTDEQSIMRTTLVPSLLDTVARNLAYQQQDLRLFELRPVFLAQPGEELPAEKWRLCVALCGQREPEGWAQDREKVDFFDLKGAIEDLLIEFNIVDATWQPGLAEPFLHPGKSCVVRHGDTVLGTVGEVHPRVLERWEIDLPVFLCDLDLEQLFAVAADHAGFQPLSRFPQVYRDSALLIDEQIPADEVFRVLNRARGRFVEDIVLFDLYRGAGIPEGKKSLAIRVRYRSIDKTLTDDEIQSAHDKLVRSLTRQLKAEIR
jgi:phenylalanyl-tRNA synthetase beta chain